jgi:hypothetical protein
MGANGAAPLQKLHDYGVELGMGASFQRHQAFCGAIVEAPNGAQNGEERDDYERKLELSLAKRLAVSVEQKVIHNEESRRQEQEYRISLLRLLEGDAVVHEGR